MIAGRGTADQQPARRLALESPARMQQLVDLLVDASVKYLAAQIEAGADVVMIFDSWAGTLDAEGFAKWVNAPTRELVRRVRAVHPKAPIIVFPKGAGARIGDYAEQVDANAIGVDWTLPMRLAADLVPARYALQGNLDPLRLVVGGAALDDGVDEILAAMKGRAHIFNLGHGITPNAPIDNVFRLVERVRRSER